MRKLSLKGKVTIFESLAISKIVHLAIITKFPNTVIEELKQIQKTFSWDKKKVKTKQNTLRNDYKDGGLKSVDIEHKIASLKCSWVKHLYTENFHEWKIFPSQYINKLSGKNFKFHSNLNVPKNTLSYFPSFYKDILKLWSKYYSNQPSLPSTILSQYLRFNSFIKIDNEIVFHKKFSEKNINFVNDLIKENGKFKTWDQITLEFKIDKNLHFKWIQLVHAIPNHWKIKLTENTISSQNLPYLNHHLIKNNQIHCFEKLTAKELYLISLQHEIATPTSQKYLESVFRNVTLQWKHIYTFPYAFPRITTIDSKLQCFQYKILHNPLYINQKLFLFR